MKYGPMIIEEWSLMPNYGDSSNFDITKWA